MSFSSFPEQRLIHSSRFCSFLPSSMMWPQMLWKNSAVPQASFWITFIPRGIIYQRSELWRESSSVCSARNSQAHLIVFHRLVKKNASFLPEVCLVSTQGPQHLVIFVRLLVPQLDLQGAHVCAGHVVPESHAVGRVLWVNHGAQQSGDFAFLAFVSLWVNEVAISYCDRRTALGIAISFHLLCLPKKPQPPWSFCFLSMLASQASQLGK